jgi:solute carrier family 25 oxoglutarate transporter 11
MPGVIEVQEKKRGHFAEVFFAAQAGVLSTVLTQPFEFMKVHCQLAGKDHRGAQPRGLILARQAIAEHGFHKLWAGVEPALASRANYIAMRLGIYKAVVEKAKKEDRYHSVPVWYKACAAAYAGGLSGFANAPLDLIATRMQADILLPEAQRKNYPLMPPAVAKVYHEEGIRGLWKGSLPTTLKMIALNVGMLAPYDQFLEFSARHVGDLAGVKFVAAYYAAVCGCLLATPFDNVKTKMQVQLPGVHANPYKNMTDCVMKTFAREGFAGFYVGYWMHVARVGPQAFLALKILEYFNYYI